MPDGDRAHGAVEPEFVDDPVDANPVGPQPGEPSTQLVTEVRVAFELTERIQHRVCAQEVERGQCLPCGAGEADPRHYERSRVACSARTSSSRSARWVRNSRTGTVFDVAEAYLYAYTKTHGISGLPSAAVRSWLLGGPCDVRAAAGSTLVSDVTVTVLDPSIELRLHRLPRHLRTGFVLPLARPQRPARHHPIAAVRRPSRDATPRQTRLTRHELANRLNAAETVGGSVDAMACLLLLNRLRVSEVCGIDIGDLAEERWHHTVTIHGKGDKDATGLLSGAVLAQGD